MKSDCKTPRQLAAENDELRARLEEAEETLHALGTGAVDAIVVSGVGGEQVYALKGADYSYRILVEEMSDGALTVAADGTILSANRRFAEIAKVPSAQVIGTAATRWIAADVLSALQSPLGYNAAGRYHGESVLTASDGAAVPIRIAAGRQAQADMPDCIGLVISDLTELRQRQREEVGKLVVQATLQGKLDTESASRRQLLGVIEDQKQAAEALLISAEKYRLQFESSRDALMTVAPPSWTFTSANRATVELFGASSAAEITALGPAAVSPTLQPDGQPSSEKAQAMIAIALREGSNNFHWVHQRLDGTPFVADVLLTRMQLGEEVFLQATVRDISERERTTRELKLFRELLDHSSDAIEVFEPTTMRLLDVNQRACTDLGYTRDELLTMTIFDIDSQLQSELTDERMRTLREAGAVVFETTHRRKDGLQFAVEVNLNRVETDREYLLAIVRDITERRRLDAQLAHAVSHDAITGLPRHGVLETALAAQLEDGSRPVWILFIGIDRFQLINESMGHVVGDELLKHIARRLGDALGQDGELTRFDGDQFVVAAADLDQAAALDLAERLRAAIAVPIDSGVYRLLLTASIGISHSPAHGRTVQDLLRRGQAAMTQAKRHGRDCSREFSVEQMLDIEDRLQLGSHLRGAIERGELELHYQSQHEAGLRSLCGFEALLRWKNDALGQVPPGRFIPVAEALGLIPEIGEWVLDEACRQARIWIDRGHGDVCIAVNVAAAQLQRPGLVAQVRTALQRHGVPPEMLSIELTESALMENVARLRDRLAELKALGVVLSLDDFGTGYSSLAYLKQFPIDKLKIDQSFVRGLPDDGDDAIIARTIVAMSHQLQMTVVAEGVETQAQADFLEGVGCDELQGYLFGRPAPAAEAERFFPDPGR